MKALKVLQTELPRRCAKCGSERFELEEDGLQCFYCCWIFYLTDAQIDAIKREGLDKTKSVCNDRSNR